jgi:hypothetical protein
MAMHARLRGDGVVSMMVILLAAATFGCDWFPGRDGGDLPPWPSSTPPATPDAAPVPLADAGSLPDRGSADDGYDAMCLHYCKTLQETDVLACLSSGRYDADCAAATASTTDTCFDLRCRPRRVDVSLCLIQCDALARFYTGRCPVAGNASDPSCASSQADHDAACRSGCVL